MTNKKLTILTCMDSRMDPIKISGIAQDEAYIIRNAGGRATDEAIDSMILTEKFFDVREWWVIHHSDCLMGNLQDHQMSALPETIRGNIFLDLEKSVIDDINLIRSHESVHDHIEIKGFIFDLEENLLTPI